MNSCMKPRHFRDDDSEEWLCAEICVTQRNPKWQRRLKYCVCSSHRTWLLLTKMLPKQKSIYKKGDMFLGHSASESF